MACYLCALSCSCKTLGKSGCSKPGFREATPCCRSRNALSTTDLNNGTRERAKNSEELCKSICIAVDGVGHPFSPKPHIFSLSSVLPVYTATLLWKSGVTGKPV